VSFLVPALHENDGTFDNRATTVGVIVVDAGACYMGTCALPQQAFHFPSGQTQSRSANTKSFKGRAGRIARLDSRD
jgi:hypothetical protein